MDSMLVGMFVVKRLVEAEHACAGKPFNHLQFVFVVKIT